MKIPEGPELAHSRDRLRKLVCNKRVLHVHLLGGGRYASTAPVGMRDFLDQVRRAETVVETVDVKGKFMWWTFRSDDIVWRMWSTYGMSGQWTTAEPDKHTAVVMWFKQGDDEKRVSFRDPRHFGTLRFVNDEAQHLKKLASLGPDMLADPPDINEFRTILLKRPKLTLPEALMNQSIVSGVGNYIKAEALYRARLSPHRITGSLSVKETAMLRGAIIQVMTEAYNSKGATIKTYATADGERGNAQFSFQAYGRKHDPFGNDIIKEETRDRRTTHWCPNIQR